MCVCVRASACVCVCLTGRMASSGERAVEARANGATGADADSDCEWDFLLTAAPKAPQARANGAAGADADSDSEWDFLLTAKPAVEALDVPTKKCRRCSGRLPESDPLKTCAKCRDRAKSRAFSTKYKLAKRVRAARYRVTEKTRAWRKNYRATSEKWKASRKRYETSAAGRARQKQRASKPMNRLSNSLRLMVKGLHECPVTFPKLGLFTDNCDAQAHLQSTFLPWMNWSNHGKRVQDTLPNTVWQIGHRVPKVWYRHEDMNELKKCWSRANLFAQCAVDNHDARDRNILSQAQWLALKAIWPKQCVGMTDEQAWAWCRDNVDNATRRAARAAAKTAGPSDEAGPSDLRTVEDEEASSEDEGPVALDAYDSDTLVFSDDSDDEASSDDEAD